MPEGGRLGRGCRAGGKGLRSWGIAGSFELQRWRSRAEFGLEEDVSEARALRQNGAGEP